MKITGEEEVKSLIDSGKHLQNVMCGRFNVTQEFEDWRKQVLRTLIASDLPGALQERHWFVERILEPGHVGLGIQCLKNLLDGSSEHRNEEFVSSSLFRDSRSITVEHWIEPSESAFMFVEFLPDQWVLLYHLVDDDGTEETWAQKGPDFRTFPYNNVMVYNWPTVEDHCRKWRVKGFRNRDVVLEDVKFPENWIEI